MKKLLSDRYNPPVFESLIYGQVTEKFINQMYHRIAKYLDGDRDFIDEIVEDYLIASGITYGGSMFHFFNLHNPTETLDFIDFCCQKIHDCFIVDYKQILTGHCGEISPEAMEYKQSYDEFCNDINEIFKVNGMGYRLKEDGMVYKIGSEGIYEDVLVPALKYLEDGRFKNADSELREAFEKYKRGDSSGAALSATKALESTIKIICRELNLDFNENKDSLSRLLSILKDSGFFEPWVEERINSTIKNLGSAAGPRNNSNAAHGKGTNTDELEEFFAGFSINAAATDILLLVDIFRYRKQETGA